MSRPCLRHIERRYEILPGISLLDLALCLVFGLAIFVLVHWILGMIGGFALFAFLKYIHEGKPRAFLWLLAYRFGILGRLPEGFRPAGFVPAPSIFGARRRTYSAVAGEADDEGAASRAYFSGKDLH